MESFFLRAVGLGGAFSMDDIMLVGFCFRALWGLGAFSVGNMVLADFYFYSSSCCFFMSGWSWALGAFCCGGVGWSCFGAGSLSRVWVPILSSAFH